MSYTAPVTDMLFTMRHVAGFDAALAQGLYGDMEPDLAGSILEEAGRFAADIIAPLNRVGDTDPARFEAGAVRTSPGWREAYRAWVEAGWGALSGPEEHGGQALPAVIGAACTETWNAASMAFGVAPLLTAGAIGLFRWHATLRR